MSGRSLACAVVVLCASAVTPSFVSAEPRAVLELFTSQGCSSCPAADKLMGEFASDPTLLAMSLAIDYWDYLGWKDTLALAGHSRRQKSYASARHDREVYTPQVVVNGTAHVLGSDKSAIERAIAQTRATEANSVAPSRSPSRRQAQRQCPAGGEEAPPRSGYARSQSPLRWRSGAAKIRPHDHLSQRRPPLAEARRVGRQGRSWNVPLADFAVKDIDTVAVLVQRGATTSPGLVLGAAMMGLK